MSTHAPSHQLQGGKWCSGYKFQLYLHCRCYLPKNNPIILWDSPGKGKLLFKVSSNWNDSIYSVLAILCIDESVFYTWIDFFFFPIGSWFGLFPFCFCVYNLLSVYLFLFSIFLEKEKSIKLVSQWGIGLVPLPCLQEIGEGKDPSSHELNQWIPLPAPLPLKSGIYILYSVLQKEGIKIGATTFSSAGQLQLPLFEFHLVCLSVCAFKYGLWLPGLWF